MNYTYYRNLTNDEIISHAEQFGTTLLEYQLASRLAEEIDSHAETKDDLDCECVAHVKLQDSYDQLIKETQNAK